MPRAREIPKWVEWWLDFTVMFIIAGVVLLGLEGLLYLLLWAFNMGLWYGIAIVLLLLSSGFGFAYAQRDKEQITATRLLDRLSEDGKLLREFIEEQSNKRPPDVG